MVCPLTLAHAPGNNRYLSKVDCKKDKRFDQKAERARKVVAKDEIEDLLQVALPEQPSLAQVVRDLPNIMLCARVYPMTLGEMSCVFGI